MSLPADTFILDSQLLGLGDNKCNLLQTAALSTIYRIPSRDVDPQIPNTMNWANVCSKWTYVPTGETGSVRKQSSLQREKVLAGNNLSNTKQHVLSLLHCHHWNSRRLGRKLSLKPPRPVAVARRYVICLGERTVQTQSFYFFLPV